MAESLRGDVYELAGLASDLADQHSDAALQPYREDIQHALEGLRAVEAHLPEPDRTRRSLT